MAGNGMGESIDGFVQRRGEGFDRQAFEGLDQRMRETVQSVTMADDGLSLHLVEYFTHLLRVYS